MSNRTDTQRTRQRSPVILAVLAVAAVAIIAVTLSFFNAPELDEDPVFAGDATDLPAGAGSAPDGAADMERGGLTDGTVAEDAVDQTINSDNVPALLQEGGDPVPEPSAESLEPIGSETEPVLPEIADETELTVPGVEEGDPAQ
jgi:hypothetical protein